MWLGTEYRTKHHLSGPLPSRSHSPLSLVGILLCRNSNFGENTVMGVFRRDPHSELLMPPQFFCLFVKAVIEGHVYRLVQSWLTVRSA